MSIEDIVYTGPYYYPEDKNGIHGIEPLAVFGMLVLWFVIVSVFKQIKSVKPFDTGLQQENNFSQEFK